MTLTQSQFDAYPADIQAKLQQQGVTIVPDPVETNETVAPTGAANDLLAGVEEKDEEEDSGLSINIYIKIGDQRRRVTFQSLDSDFAKFLDKEHTQRNNVRDSIVHTVEKHGIAKANEGIQFEVELTKRGESGFKGDTDLLA